LPDKPAWGGERLRYTWGARMRALPTPIPSLGIFLAVVGSIYAGLATPTEAASLGVVAVLALAATNGMLTLDMLRQAIEGTMRTTAVIRLIIIAAVFLNFVLSIIGLTQAVADFGTGLG
tara:strand:+ start:223 stop:579 length:357 start_codon:yes stop_codon:yes gene_type:complete